MRFFGRKRSRTREGPETPVASERRRERPTGEEAYGGRLTDEDLDFLTELKPEKGQQLRDLLCRNHEDADVDLYVAFMDIPVTSAS